MLQAVYSLFGLAPGTVLSYDDLVILFLAALVIIFTVTSFLQLIAAIFNLRR